MGLGGGRPLQRLLVVPGHPLGWGGVASAFGWGGRPGQMMRTGTGPIGDATGQFLVLRGGSSYLGFCTRLGSLFGL
jgi:hypothetical protein